MIIDLDPLEWTHVSRALQKHMLWCRDNGVPVPDSVRALAAYAYEHDSERHRPTPVGDELDLLHAALVNSKLAVTYAETAQRLGVSKRHVERLVASGKLPCVDIGGAPRIRIADLEDYVASLVPGRRDFRDGIVGKQAS